MGSCVSVHKDHESAVRFSVESKNDKVLIQSPVKQRDDAVNDGDRTVADVAIKSQLAANRFVHAGSKDEAFFDSQPWLESDCEDDFLSVNGDFTPSRGNTPVHHKFSSGSARVSNARVSEAPPEPSPPDKKKRLSELFKESLRGNELADEETYQPKSTSATPYRSGANSRASSERTPNGDLGEEDKSMRSGQCCLPRLISSRSFSERKKRISPPQKVG